MKDRWRRNKGKDIHSLGKSFLALLLIAAMLSTGTLSYAADFSEEEWDGFIEESQTDPAVTGDEFFEVSPDMADPYEKNNISADGNWGETDDSLTITHVEDSSFEEQEPAAKVSTQENTQETSQETFDQSKEWNTADQKELTAVDGFDSIHLFYNQLSFLPENAILLLRVPKEEEKQENTEEEQKSTKEKDSSQREEEAIQKAEAALGWKEEDTAISRYFEPVIVDSEKKEETFVLNEPVMMEIRLYDEAVMDDSQKQEYLPKRQQLIRDMHLENLQIVRLLNEDEVREIQSMEDETADGKLPYEAKEDETFGTIYYQILETTLEDGCVRFRMDRMSPFVCLIYADAAEDGTKDFFSESEEGNSYETGEITEDVPENEDTVVLSESSPEGSEEPETDGSLKQLISGGENYEVSVTYDTEAKIPEGSELIVNELSENEEDYENLTEKAMAAIDADEDSILSVKLVDISIEKDGEMVEPEAEVGISVQVFGQEENSATETQVICIGETTEVLEVSADVYEDGSGIADKEDVVGNAEQSENYETTTRTMSQIYAIVEKTFRKVLLASDGKTYEVIVTYRGDAQIPEGAELEVKEIPEETEEYDSYLNQTADAISKTPDSISYARLLDISIVKDGEEITLAAPVDVQIRLKDKEESKEEEALSVVHFGEKPKVVDAEIMSERNGDVVSFAVDGFSVYAIVYTVDFHWGEYTYNLQGGKYYSAERTFDDFGKKWGEIPSLRRGRDGISC